jgi:hypothetical protein
MKINNYIRNSMVATLLLATFFVGCKDNNTSPDVDENAPVIFSMSPMNNEDNVERNKVIDIVFDQAMNPTTINNNPTSSFTGDLGLSPMSESFITGFSQSGATGFSTSTQVSGRIYASDMGVPTPANLTTAVDNMISAYNNAEERSGRDFINLHGGDISGKTLSPGLYEWSNSVRITQNITFAGDANDVWILQVNDNVTMNNDINITLTGGALAEHIFWQVGGIVTIGTDAHFEGIILSMNGVTMNKGASINGRVLTRAGAIFDGNTVTEPQ